MYSYAPMIFTSQPNSCLCRSLAPFHFRLELLEPCSPQLDVQAGVFPVKSEEKSCMFSLMLVSGINRFVHSDGGPVASIHLSCLVYMPDSTACNTTTVYHTFKQNVRPLT